MPAGKRTRASPAAFLEVKLTAMAQAHPDVFCFRVEGEQYIFEAAKRVTTKEYWTSLKFDTSITTCRTWTNFRRQLIAHLYLADSDAGGQRTKQRGEARYFRYVKSTELAGKKKKSVVKGRGAAGAGKRMKLLAQTVTQLQKSLKETKTELDIAQTIRKNDAEEIDALKKETAKLKGLLCSQTNTLHLQSCGPEFEEDQDTNQTIFDAADSLTVATAKPQVCKVDTRLNVFCITDADADSIDAMFALHAEQNIEDPYESNSALPGC
jgi:hypothetical protein